MGADATRARNRAAVDGAVRAVNAGDAAVSDSAVAKEVVAWPEGKPWYLLARCGP